MNRLELCGQLNNGKGVNGKIEKAACTQNHQRPVIPWHMVHPDVASVQGIDQIADDDDKRHKQGQPDLRQCLAEQGHQNAVHGEGRHQAPKDELGDALPDTGVGFPVIFFHDRVHIRLNVPLHLMNLMLHLPGLLPQLFSHLLHGVPALFEQAHNASSFIPFISS